jgi:hypothetical protein
VTLDFCIQASTSFSGYDGSSGIISDREDGRRMVDNRQLSVRATGPLSSPPHTGAEKLKKFYIHPTVLLLFPFLDWTLKTLSSMIVLSSISTRFPCKSSSSYHFQIGRDYPFLFFDTLATLPRGKVSPYVIYLTTSISRVIRFFWPLILFILLGLVPSILVSLASF